MKARLAALCVAFAAAVANAATSELLQPGATAPDFTVYTADNRAVKLSDFAGKVVLLDFWATWCYPCRVTMPHMETLHQRFGPRGVVVLGVCVFDVQSAFNNYTSSRRTQTTYQVAFDRGGSTPSSIASSL